MCKCIGMCVFPRRDVKIGIFWLETYSDDSWINFTRMFCRLVQAFNTAINYKTKKVTSRQCRAVRRRYPYVLYSARILGHSMKKKVVINDFLRDRGLVPVPFRTIPRENLSDLGFKKNCI